MLTRHQASLDDKKKFTALVKDLFPDQAKNVNLLLMAYNMGIAQDIQTASHGRHDTYPQSWKKKSGRSN